MLDVNNSYEFYYEFLKILCGNNMLEDRNVVKVIRMIFHVNLRNNIISLFSTSSVHTSHAKLESYSLEFAQILGTLIKGTVSFLCK